VIKYLSYTSLNMFVTCGKQWELHYVNGIRTPVNAELIRGDAYHKAIAAAYGYVVAYRTHPKLDEVLQIFSDIYDERIKERIIVNDAEQISVPGVIFDDKKSPGVIKDEGIALIKKYLAGLFTKIIPEEIECRKTTLLDGDIPLLSFVDLIDFGGIVYDHKTGTKTMDANTIEREFQSCFYAITMELDNIEFHIHQALALKNPEVKDIPIKRSSSDISWVEDLIRIAWRDIQEGRFIPRPSGWHCSRDYCGYWPYCRVPKSF